MNFDFPLTAEHAQRYARIMEEGTGVRRHYDMLMWLQGEIQFYLPHEIMLCAWGDFESGLIRYDIISALLGIRTDSSNIRALAPLLQGQFNLWISLGKIPYTLEREDSVFLLEEYGLQCALGVALRGMRLAMVHGVSDKRGQHDSLYIAFSSREKSSSSSLHAMQFLLPYLDAAMGQIDSVTRERHLSSVPLEMKGKGLIGLEERILALIKAGKTNGEIAAQLQISIIALKNQLRAMFTRLHEQEQK